MNLCRCENGHFYDRDKYDSCPHCASGVGPRKEDDLTDVFEDTPTEPLSADSSATIPTESQIDVTEPSGNSNVRFNPVQENPSPAPAVKFNINESTDIINPRTAEIDPIDDDDDHTISYFDFIEEDKKNDEGSKVEKTEAPSPQSAAKKPKAPGRMCVGWVVSLGGNHFGEDFALKVGKNFVGRGEDMDVSLTGDKSVSRNKHAIIVYEPKQHLYLVQPGEASELAYLNNKVVLSPMQLKPYDIITVGEINLLFMPLCGEQFNWVDAMRDR